jgi:DNA-binding ferritin-like protein
MDKGSKMEELIQRIFAARNLAHLAHWNESSGYRHEALGEFYDDVVDSLDCLVEASMALNGKVGFPMLPSASGDILNTLNDDLVFINQNRDQITSGVSALNNLLDNISALYMKTIFKLTQLQ